VTRRCPSYTGASLKAGTLEQLRLKIFGTDEPILNALGCLHDRVTKLVVLRIGDIRVARIREAPINGEEPVF